MRMSTSILRIQSGMAYQTSPSGMPDENERSATEAVRLDRSARARLASAPAGFGWAGAVTAAPACRLSIRGVPLIEDESDSGEPGVPDDVLRLERADDGAPERSYVVGPVRPPCEAAVLAEHPASPVRQGHAAVLGGVHAAI